MFHVIITLSHLTQTVFVVGLVVWTLRAQPAGWWRWLAGLDCQRLTVALFSLYSSRLIRLALYQCRASVYLHALEKFLTAMQINTTASQWFEFSFITSRCKTWPLVMSSYEKFKSNVYQSRN